MKIVEVYFLERVKTTDYAYKELKMTAVIEENDNAAECSRMLEGLVKSQLGLVKGEVNVNTTATASEVASNNTRGTTVSEPPSSDEVKKATKAEKAKATRAANKAKKEAAEIESMGEVTREQVQNSLRDVAVYFKDGAKAVAIIEKVAGVKTLADVPENKLGEIVAYAKKVVAA